MQRIIYGMNDRRATLARRTMVYGFIVQWCMLLLVARIIVSDRFTYSFLAWNLFLALIPLAASALVRIVDDRRGATAIQLAAGAVWLAFLPNAPYVVTDLIHLRHLPHVPLWYDLAMLVSFAGAGLLFGYRSVANIHHVIERRFGAAAGWSVAIGSLLLSGFGIYLGRFLRWNSWEIVTDPLSLAGVIVERLVNPTAHPGTIAITAVFGGLLAVGYVALHLVAPTPAER